MSDLRWLCEVVHTWGQNTRGTLPVRGLTIGGTKSDAHEVQRCDFCKRGHVTGCNKGSVSASVPIRAMSLVVSKSPSGFVSAGGKALESRHRGDHQRGRSARIRQASLALFWCVYS